VEIRDLGLKISQLDLQFSPGGPLVGEHLVEGAESVGLWFGMDGDGTGVGAGV
jgi:hypothetical protein